MMARAMTGAPLSHVPPLWNRASPVETDVTRKYNHRTDPSSSKVFASAQSNCCLQSQNQKPPLGGTLPNLATLGLRGNGKGVIEISPFLCLMLSSNKETKKNPKNPKTDKDWLIWGKPGQQYHGLQSSVLHFNIYRIRCTELCVRMLMCLTTKTVFFKSKKKKAKKRQSLRKKDNFVINLR